jgi:hypothetical protein
MIEKPIKEGDKTHSKADAILRNTQTPTSHPFRLGGLNAVVHAKQELKRNSSLTHGIEY